MVGEQRPTETLREKPCSANGSGLTQQNGPQPPSLKRLLALIGTNAVEVVTVSLRDSAIASIVAAGLSVAKSLAALRAPGADGSASLLNDKG
jgi:hypothetical protein